MNGPYAPCYKPDQVIANLLLPQALGRGETYVADSIYNNDFAIRPEDAETEYEHWYMAWARARHEQINRLFKRFKVIKNVFKRDVNKHGIFTHAIANILQIGIEHGEVYVWLDMLPPPWNW